MGLCQGFYNVGFKNKHTGEIQLLETIYGDPVQYNDESAAMYQVTILNSVSMINGEFVAIIEPESDN